MLPHRPDSAPERRSRTVRYGPGASQVVDLTLPAGIGPHPVAVLVHGGFWQLPHARDLMEPLAQYLAARGIAGWNVEYRRVGEPGGGWPGTLADVAAAVDALADAAGDGGVDTTRVAVIGHSAGGQLALWLAARAALPPSAVGAAPRVRPAAVVSLAGVADLHAADAVRLGDGPQGAAAALLGGRVEEVPERYAVASPLSRLPLRMPVLLVHGDADDRVPLGQSRAFAAAARAAGDAVNLWTPSGVGHFDVIDPAHPAWRAAAAWVERQLSEPGPAGRALRFGR